MTMLLGATKLAKQAVGKQVAGAPAPRYAIPTFGYPTNAMALENTHAHTHTHTLPIG